MRCRPSEECCIFPMCANVCPRITQHGLYYTTAYTHIGLTEYIAAVSRYEC